LTALIDGDILVYVVGYASDDVNEHQATSRVLRTFNTIINATQSSNYRMFVSDSRGNFRNKLFPLYKANRTAPKPVHYQHITNVLLDKLGAEVTFGEEADDALGILSSAYSDSIIVSIDKDLLQVPGLHYNWRTSKYTHITEAEGRHRFWSQVLTGDTTDNITSRVGLSCPGVGAVKAAKILEWCSTNEEYYHSTRSAYKTYLPDYDDVEIDARLELTAQLVHIRRKAGHIWSVNDIQEQMGG